MAALGFWLVWRLVTVLACVGFCLAVVGVVLLLRLVLFALSLIYKFIFCFSFRRVQSTEVGTVSIHLQVYIASPTSRRSSLY